MSLVGRRAQFTAQLLKHSLFNPFIFLYIVSSYLFFFLRPELIQNYSLTIEQVVLLHLTSFEHLNSPNLAGLIIIRRIIILVVRYFYTRCCTVCSDKNPSII